MTFTPITPRFLAKLFLFLICNSLAWAGIAHANTPVPGAYIRPITPITPITPVPGASIKPVQAQAGCQLILNNPSVDFGNINLYDAQKNDLNYQHAAIADVDAAKGTSVGKQLRTLHVSCSTPTKFALRFRAAADTSNHGYAMGKRGVLLLTLTRAQADGKPTQLTVNPAPVMSPINPASTVVLRPNQSAQAVINNQITAVSNLTVQVEVQGKMDVRTQRLRSNRVFTAEGFFEIVNV